MRSSVNINNTTKEQVFNVLYDFNGYVEWMPDIQDASVIAQEGDIFVADFCSPELMEEKYQLEFVCSRPTSITFKQIGIFEETGKHFNGLYGSWNIIDSPEGNGTTISGAMHYKPNTKMSNLIFQRRLDMLSQMFSQPSTFTQDFQPLSGLDADIKEAFQAEGFAVWFLGSKYLYKKVE
ncbi:SAM-dependent methyltransferases related to tRNA (uracil-5-)-methyltransferase [Candidatus Scalindua japonica]|uniref:SAM-dependent methyltransferases related to tRNA (Uracil-5-)-methyltransferase n=1 Tax=Candidatus Scalindua japonica TaxID=1284222 RepID=A0A286TTG0_9BACT|nr:SRPBCC family protein [Candidatus Scalindua japonica]GAX59166.1 SAM-dependent methyltransferases related to tRNA (uracil-5-)-methyltransferase [Candidatus Scalindua japonica]